MFNKIKTITVISLFIIMFLSMIKVGHAHLDIDLQIESLDQEIASDMDNAQLYLKRAELQRRHSAWELALQDYAKAEEYGTATNTINFYRGRMYRESGQSNIALPLLNDVLEQEPNHIFALVERAKIASHPKTQAIADLDLAITLSEQPSPDLFLSRAKLMLADENSNFQDITKGIQQGVEQLGPIVSLIEFGVTSAEAQQEWAAALTMLNELPDILTQSPTWLYKQGQLQENLNENEAAQETYQQALQKINELPASRSNSPAFVELKQQIMEAIE